MSIRQRLYPTDEQSLAMVEWCHQARFVYNVLTAELRQYLEAKDSGGAWVWERHRGHLVRRLRERLPWLAEGPSVVHQGAMRDFESALRRWNGKSANAPSFHKRDAHSGSFVIRDLTVKRLNRKWAVVSVPKVGRVRFRLSYGFSEILRASSARVRHQNGQWHISFVTVPAEKSRKEGRGIVGIDRGVAITLATSDGDTYLAPKLGESQRDRFLRLERAVARTKKGSENRKRLHGQLARLRQRQNDLNRNFVEQTTTDLARRYETVVLEDLKITNMVRSPAPKPDPESPGDFLPNGSSAKAKLSRLIHGSLWGRLHTRLSDKTNVVLVDPRYTSLTCSNCGHVAKENRESQAVFLCVECGHGENADLNAAKNILARAEVNPRTSGDRAESEDDANLLDARHPTMMVA